MTRGVNESRAEIMVRFDHAGLHLWNNPPRHRAYLAHPHRHLFKVEVMTSVGHDDREIEFHDLHDFSKSQFAAGFCREDSAGFDASIGRSCEMMARELGAVLAAKYLRFFEVSVWEDGEFGARVFTHAPGK